MTIRRAQKEDLSSIARLAKEMVELHYSIDAYYKSPENFADLETGLEKDLNDRDGIFLVAEDNGKIIGYFRGEIRTAPEYAAAKKIGFVYDILVTEKYRGKNIGEKLFKEALDWFGTKKIKRIELSVDARNEVGVKFWKKLGFENYKLRLKLDL